MSASGGGGDFSVNYGDGSSAINGFFRTVWTLGRINEGNGKFSKTRALCLSKNNYSLEDPPTILFNLSAEGFKWAGIDKDFTANDLFNPRKQPTGRPNNQISLAKQVISDFLANGRQPSELLYEETNKHGISKSTLKRAKQELNIKPYKEKNDGKEVWFWELPQTPIILQSYEEGVK
jgi:hypothetical protein